MSRKSSFIKGFASTTAQSILIKIIGFLVTPIVLTYLNPTEYGIWVIIGSLLGYMGLMDFGVTGATTAIAAKSNTSENENKINVLINNSFVLQCLIGLLIIVVGGVFSIYFPNIFEMNNYSKDDAWLVFLLATIGYGISMPPKALKGLIRARQMIALLVWLEFALFILTTSLNLLLLHLGFGLLALPLGTICLRILSYPLFIYVAKKSYPNLSIDLSCINYGNMKNIFGVSLYWFVGMLAAMVIYSTDTILIGVFINAALVTTYALSYRLTEVLREFIYSFNFTLMPALGQLMGQGDKCKVRDLYLKSQPIILSIAFMASAAIYLFNGMFVSFWVGEDYFAGESISLIFASILFFGVVFQSSSVILTADLKVKDVTYVRIFEAILNITLSLWLIDDYGLLGVAIATLFSAIVTSFWIIPCKAIALLDISFAIWGKKVLLKLLIVMVFVGICTISLKLLLNNSLINGVESALLFILSTVLIFWYGSLNPDIRTRVCNKVKHKTSTYI